MKITYLVRNKYINQIRHSGKPYPKVKNLFNVEIPKRHLHQLKME